MGRFHRHDAGTSHTHEHDQMQGDLATDHQHDDDAMDQTGDLGDMSSYQTGLERVVVLERIFGENDRCAARNRAALDEAGVVAINMMSSPGAGKTAILERTLAHMDNPSRVGIIEGDIETSIDADRLDRYGAHVALLNTSNGFGGECHLDAPMVANALKRLDLAAIDTLFVENVGNLVCPAEFDVGTRYRAMVYAITEGEEKPLKYPVMFRAVDLVLVNKVDLRPYLDFDMDLFEQNLRMVNPNATVLHLSARTGEGLGGWYEWLGKKASGLAG